MKHIIFRFLLALAILALLAAGAMVVGDYLLTRERLPYNTFIETVNVSLMTQREAVNAIEAMTVDDAISSPIIVYYKDQDYFFLPSDLGIKIDASKSVKNAFRKTHDKSYIKELQNRLAKESVLFPFALKVDGHKLYSALESIAEQVSQEAKEASIVLHGKGAYNIVKHQTGRELKVAETHKRFRQALAKGERLLPLIIDEVEPKITYEDLVEAPPVHLLSKYTTYYGSHDSPNRIHNIKLIANTMVDGTILLPDEVLSVADAIGEVTAAKGFREAFVIFEGELVPQFGGGTCQVATTLYNTAALADLEILKRRNHSLYFYIYPLGRDAAIYGKNPNLIFKNNTRNPVYIKARATNKSLTFKIFGTPTGKKVYFSRPEIVYRGADGRRKVSWRPPKNTPFSTKVERTVRKDGKIIEQETIRSFYKLVGDGGNVVIRRPEPR